MTTEQPSGPVLETLDTGRKRTTGDLGPKQVQWLKDNVYQFKTAKEQAVAAQRHTEEVASQIAKAS